jgi:hypothetical protein
MNTSLAVVTARSILQTTIRRSSATLMKIPTICCDSISKGSDFSRLTVEAVNQVAARINLCPRKCLA